MIDPYFIIQHQSLKDTLKLIEAHGDIQRGIETEPSPPPSSKTALVPTSPTVPVKRVA